MKKNIRLIFLGTISLLVGFLVCWHCFTVYPADTLGDKSLPEEEGVPERRIAEFAEINRLDSGEISCAINIIGNVSHSEYHADGLDYVQIEIKQQDQNSNATLLLAVCPEDMVNIRIPVNKPESMYIRIGRTGNYRMRLLSLQPTLPSADSMSWNESFKEVGIVRQ
ncbi:MAG: hypothetical protein PHX30_04495 [Candidatus Pacebacteria bacterium]|nr:hypothetical protein [Candidatus Paceibacterota bacterium]